MNKLHFSLAKLACTRSMRVEDARRGSKIPTREGRKVMKNNTAKWFLLVVTSGLLLGAAARSSFAQTCTPVPPDCTCPTQAFVDPEPNTSLNAFLINPATEVTGTIVATNDGTVTGIPCNIAVLFNNGQGQVGDKKSAQVNISLATHYGVLIDGSVNNVAVDVANTTVHDIGEPGYQTTKGTTCGVTGCQQGIGISYRAFQLGGMTGTAGGTVSNVTVYNYEKGGIEANGQGVNTTVRDSTVTGTGPVASPAQNGIQIGFGASASVTGNGVSANSYHNPDDSTTAATGVLVAGGPTYNNTPQCPGSSSASPCPYTTGTMVLKNTLTNNDVGAYLFNALDNNLDAPSDMTNNKVTNNTMSASCSLNVYVVGASVIGNNDKVVNNNMTGYTGSKDSNTGLGCFPVDPSPTPGNPGTSTKVHASPHP